MKESKFGFVNVICPCGWEEPYILALEPKEIRRTRGRCPKCNKDLWITFDGKWTAIYRSDVEKVKK